MTNSLQVVRKGVRSTGTGQPIVFLPGLGLSSGLFAPLVNRLESTFRCICIENPVHWHEIPPTDRWSIPKMSNAVAMLMEELSCCPAVIAGHSMGGFIAQQLAMDHPDRVESLVLMASSPVFRKDGLILAVRGSTRLRIRRNLLHLAMPGFDKQHPESLDSLLEDILTHGGSGRTFQEQFKAAREFDITDRLDEIRCATLILHGARDGVIPESTAHYLNETIDHSRLIVLPETGHLLPFESPTLTASALRDFLERPV